MHIPADSRNHPRRPLEQRRMLAIVLLLLICLLNSTATYTQAQSRLFDDGIEGGALGAAIEQATARMIKHQPELPPVIHVITHDDIWQFGTVAVVSPTPDVEPQSFLFLARREDENWVVAMQYTRQFQEWLALAPDTIVSQQEKMILTEPTKPAQTGLVVQGNGSAQLGFPWPVGQSRYLTGGPHGNALEALDFSGGVGAFPVNAAREGVAYHPCGSYVKIEHGNGLSTNYYHLRNVPITVGQSLAVARYQQIGTTSTDAICKGGSATGAHVHFWVQQGPNSQPINGIDIGGWTVQYSGTQYNGCLVRNSDGARRCASIYFTANNSVPNTGDVGSGTQPYAAQLVSATYPAKMIGGARYSISLQVKNIGLNSWNANTKIAPFPRGADSPFFDLTSWLGPTRVAAATETAPGQLMTFQFTVIAPSSPGNYQLRFSLLQEGITWFAVPSDGAINLGIAVTPAVGAQSTRPAVFRAAFARRGGVPALGYPRNDVHWWGDGGDRSVAIQDFIGADGSGNVAIIHDELRDTTPGTVPAYAIWGGIWQRYLALGGWASWLGPPTSDEFENEAGQAQSNFRNGYINYNNGAPFEVAWPAADGNWHAEYHNGHAVDSAPSWVANEAAINYDYGLGAPGNGRWGVWADHFTVRWTKRASFADGNYRFITRADDGIRLWIDDRLVIDNWAVQSLKESRYEQRLAGEHNVRVEYFENDGGAAVQAFWERVLTPAAPDGLQKAGADTGAILLTWFDNASDEQGFYIYKWQWNGSQWGFVRTASIGANRTSFIDRNLACGATYYYQVSAFNSYGESPRTPWIAAATRACPLEQPAALRASGATATSVTLAWQDTSSAEAGFKIYKWLPQNNVWDFWYWASVGANTTTYTDSGLSCGSTYFYQVSAYNASGESRRTDWIAANTSPCASPRSTLPGRNNAEPVPSPTLPAPNTPPLDMPGGTVSGEIRQ